MEDVIVTKPMIGICHMQACVQKGVEDDHILKRVNELNLCGTINGWSRVIRKPLEEYDVEGQLPVQCVDYEDREHVIIVC